MAWSVVPPDGGWHYYEKDGYKIQSDSHKNLVDSVRTYRIQNNLPLGNPEAEVDKYLCGKWPHLCGAGLTPNPVDDEAPPTAYGQRVMLGIGQRVGNWAANRYSRLGALQYVSKETAEAR